MKMRKLFAAIVAGALAATTLATAASAATTFEQTWANAAQTPDWKYSFKASTSLDVALEKGVSSITIGTSSILAGLQAKNDKFTIDTVKVNGYALNKGTDSYSSKAALVGVNADWQTTGTLPAGKYSTIEVEVIANLDAENKEAVDGWKWFHKKYEGETLKEFNIPIILNNCKGYNAVSDKYDVPINGDVVNVKTGEASEYNNLSWDITRINSGATLTLGDAKKGLTVAQKAGIANGTAATITVNFEKPLAADIAVVKAFTSADNYDKAVGIATVVKGENACIFSIPMTALYDANYGKAADGIKLTFTEGLVATGVTLEVTDAEGPSAGDDDADDTDDTDADDVDDEDDVDADDVDDADDTDADLDDTDDVDADDTDDTDADDTDSDSTDADADNTGDADDTDSAEGDKNVPTGVALAVVPAAIAAAAAIVAKKRK